MDGRYDDEWVCGRWCWLVGLVMIVVRPRVASAYRVGLLFRLMLLLLLAL